MISKALHTLLNDMYFKADGIPQGEPAKGLNQVSEIRKGDDTSEVYTPIECGCIVRKQFVGPKTYLAVRFMCDEHFEAKVAVEDRLTAQAVDV